jgi:hypothetical protein
MSRLILFLIRLKLGVKKGEAFRFSNQKNKNDKYYFSNIGVWKIHTINDLTHISLSNVSLNWLLDPRCEIEKV